MGQQHDHSHEQLTQDRLILWWVFLLNFAMFVVEIWQGLAANSTSLIADSMDFFADSVSYLITLYVLTRPLRTRAYASIFKAVIMLLLGIAVLWQGVHNMTYGVTPNYLTMSWVAVLALIVNLGSAALLFSSRGRDSNMRSVWLCSRNDAINNIGILIAAGLVFATGTLWPDLALAVFICWLETRSALQIIKQARGELKIEN